MRLNFDIKPTIIEGWGTTFSAITKLLYLNHMFYSNGKHGKYLLSVNESFETLEPKYVFAYNLEVFKRGKHRKDKHYKIYLYKFPFEVVEAMNLSIEQGTRTFKVKAIKG